MNIREMIEYMEKEGRRRDAPVFKMERATKQSVFKTLIATMLSSRTRDENTIKAVEKLFSKFQTAEKMAVASVPEIEKLIKDVGFYRVKAERVVKIATMIKEKYRGMVPKTQMGLMKLPGVGRKTANIVLARAYGMPEIGVDTHVHRIANRIGLVKTRKPEETETELKRIVPKEYAKRANRAFVAFGQTVCKPKNPKCVECELNGVCQYYKKQKDNK